MRAVIDSEIHLTGLDDAASAAIRAAMSRRFPDTTV